MRPAHRAGAARCRAEAEGYSMVELLVALTLATVLMGVGLAGLDTFFGAEASTSASYSNLDQLVPLGTVFQQDIRSAVAPAPTPTTSGTPGQPVPPFGVYGTTGAIATARDITSSSLTFFMNVGTAHGAKLAKVTTTYTNHTFTVTTTLPELSHTLTTTCPHSLTTDTSRCTFTAATARRSFTVSHVASPAIFTYHYAGTGPTHATAGRPMSPATFASCTKTACNAADIGSVGVDLLVNVAPSVGHAADLETVTYQISSASQAYNPAVG